MLVVITGGSGSGKSAFAEDYVTNLSADGLKYYLATMQVYDEEGRKKVEKHRKMREGKGFLTIEQPRSIEQALHKMKDSVQSDALLPNSKQRTVLLECMSNLTANEMFFDGKMISEEEVAAKILQGVETLSKNVEHLVIVTNNVFEDGISYEEGTMAYLRAMGNINTKLAHMADEVIEVVVGIPVILKERKEAEECGY